MSEVQVQKPKDPKKQESFKFDPVTLSTDEKVDKKFNNVFSTLLALAGGDRAKLKEPKVANDNIADIVTEFFEEQDKLLKENFKLELKKFLEDFAAYQKETQKAFNNMKAEVKKQKEIFTQRGQTLLSLFKDVNGFKSQMGKVLSAATGEAIEEEPEEETSEEDTDK